MSRTSQFVRRHAFGLVAIFIALGGTAYALETDSVRSEHIVDGQVKSPDVGNNALTGTDVDESRLNLAAERWHEVGTPGEPAFNLSINSSTGTPYCYWENYDGGSSHNSAAFLRDRHGFVHLKGLVRAQGPECRFRLTPRNHAIFTLPDGYRPAKREVQVSISNGLVARINIDGPAAFGQPAGAVSFGDPESQAAAMQWVSLDGITFRCAPSGQNGCP